MQNLLEIAAGLVFGVGVIGAVFWLTFRNPPPRRNADDATSMNPNAEYWAQNLRDNGH